MKGWFWKGRRCARSFHFPLSGIYDCSGQVIPQRQRRCRKSLVNSSEFSESRIEINCLRTPNPELYETFHSAACYRLWSRLLPRAPGRWEPSLLSLSITFFQTSRPLSMRSLLSVLSSSPFGFQEMLRFFWEKDDQRIVIDEIIGFLTTMLWVSQNHPLRDHRVFSLSIFRYSQTLSYPPSRERI